MTPWQRDSLTVVFAAAALATLFSLSFVATPVKFLAQDVPIAHLLTVGRVTFRASLGLECLLLAILMLTARRKIRWLIAGIAAILLLQWLILMPRLDERTLSRIAGNILEPSSLHHWWIALDIARVGIYAFVLRKAFLGMRSNPPNDHLES